MVKDKAIVCNLCRKMVVYAARDSGTSRLCPFCKAQINLPASDLKPDYAGGRRANPRILAMGLIFLVAAMGSAFWWLQAESENSPQRALSAEWLHPFTKTQPLVLAPNAARPKGVKAKVSITKTYYGPQSIHHDKLDRAEQTAALFCNIGLTVENYGKEAIEMHSWHVFSTAQCPRYAKLETADGRCLNLATFGKGAAPVGHRELHLIEPGQKNQDLLSFLCEKCPDDDLILVLPSENLGGKGDIRFRVPASMFQQ